LKLAAFEMEAEGDKGAWCSNQVG